jgi:hypothetical protein
MTWHRTNSLTIVLILAAIILFFLSVTPARPEELTPKQILDKIDDMFRGESSHGTMTMTIVTANWERSLSLEFWSEGKDKSLIRILAPKRKRARPRCAWMMKSGITCPRSSGSSSCRHP